MHAIRGDDAVRFGDRTVGKCQPDSSVAALSEIDQAVVEMDCVRGDGTEQGCVQVAAVTEQIRGAIACFSGLAKIMSKRTSPESCSLLFQERG